MGNGSDALGIIIKQNFGIKIVSNYSKFEISYNSRSALSAIVKYSFLKNSNKNNSILANDTHKNA